ncbi:hypothetical protein HRR83_001832 [Exophiala dermatitidis]|uniref:Beta-1,4-mannosyl-glycoprotein beta-1,4-N-acetylglucosaminyltransferase n=1 Tax=Exophiala dermatitidis TaxID=5970 RepID=A0AAN6J247_EXODE|nr:hypothetical protein HRR73_004963 [Exophiala dermatitidis]KAJ4526635.1 hypothetical protein HRR74_001835 [Exophiala dermatitidis]KAJ4532117.1 hypothetical protein HRR76_007116 [Exophiala dermatitidis]KAJ4546152.1 hypothetical protein HRR77_004689 [Exophiala dermatitidis]KAJ4567602.1 hypothetical protein HRR79_005115 [Exophiala dermatitidis]
MPVRLVPLPDEKGFERGPQSPLGGSFPRQLRSASKRYLRRLVIVAVSLFCLLQVTQLRRIRGDRVESATAGLNVVWPSDHHKASFLPVEEAAELCATQNFTVFPRRDRHRKVYDLFLIGTELDWLEIRLNELHQHVDYFVIVESPRTFTNLPKPLHFKANFERFARFAHQIIYRVVDFDGMEDSSTWEREAHQRNSLFDAVFPSLIGAQAPALGDVILVSDTDEIPRPSTITLLRNCEYPQRVTLRSRFFYYSFQWEHVDGDWGHPQATFYHGSATIRPEELRMGESDWDISNSSWHCSSCFETVEQMANKIGSFSHTEYDRPEFKDPAEIVRRVRNGLDLFDRESEQYEKVDSRADLPAYLKANEDRFAFMIDRDPLNANFKDYPPAARP